MCVRRIQEEEEEFDPYAVLGLCEEFSRAELRSAWKTRVRRCHPDRARGSNRSMRRLMLAYEVLSKPNKKRIFDHFGLRAATQFCFRKHKQARREHEQTPTTEVPKKKPEIQTLVKVRLSDIYCGNTRSVRVKYQKDCPACCIENEADLGFCSFCQGSGEDMQICELDSKRMTWKTTLKICSHCSGSGRATKPKKCFMCNGTKKIKSKTTLEFHIKPGMRHGQKILVETSVIRAVVVLHLRRHKLFKVSGDNLCMSKRISLKDCMLGSTLTIETLDGRNLHVQTPPNMALKLGQPFKVPNEGLPKYNQKDQKGDLYIRFAVDVPNEIAPGDKKIFEYLTDRFKAPTAEQEGDDEERDSPSQYLHMKRGGTTLQHPGKRHLISQKVCPQEGGTTRATFSRKVFSAGSEASEKSEKPLVDQSTASA